MKAFYILLFSLGLFSSLEAKSEISIKEHVRFQLWISGVQEQVSKPSKNSPKKLKDIFLPEEIERPLKKL